MANRIGFYTKMIMAATGASEQDAHPIEEIMREDIFHSTLDWQTKEQFNAGAKEAAALLPEYRKAGYYKPVVAPQ